MNRDEIQTMIDTVVAEAFETSGITGDALREIHAAGNLGAFVSQGFDAAIDATRWGLQALGIHLPPEVSRLMALRALMKGIHGLAPLIPSAELAIGAMGRFDSLDDFTEEDIAAAVFEVAREMGIELRTVRAVEVLDEAEKTIGAFLGIT